MTVGHREERPLVAPDQRDTERRHTGEVEPGGRLLCVAARHLAALYVDRADEGRHLLAAVEALPEEFRKVVMLYYYEDLTYRELAQLLGVSPATINARLTRARALLRERLSSCPR